MSNLSIKARILLLGLIGICGMIIAGGLGIFQLARFNMNLQESFVDIRSSMHTLIEVEQASVDFKTQIQEWKNILIRGNNAEQFAKYETVFFDRAKAFQDRLNKVADVLEKENDPAGTKVISDLEKAIKEHGELTLAYKAALGAFDKSDPEAGRKVDVAVKGKDRATTELLTKIVAEIEAGEAAQLEKQQAEALAAYASARNLLLLLMLVILSLAGVIVVFTTRHISKQIENVQHATAEVKQSLDLTLRIPVSGTDEMAQVATSVNSLLDEFHGVLKRMQEAGNQASQASDGLSHSVTQLAAAVDQQNEATSSMAAAVEEMAVTVAHVSDSSTTAQNIAQQSLAVASDGGLVIDKTVRDMGTMAETVLRTSETMEALGKRTTEIGSIAGTIKEIADQTNLLALNAAIEAARAGEQGRGFAVVADEVRKLAERTSTATQEIATVIGAIQGETRNAMDDMHRVVEQVSANANGARQAGESIVKIRDGSVRVVDVSADIASALKEQSSASELIAKQVERIASMSEENAAAMGETKSASGTMKGLSREMLELVGRFKV